MNRMHSPWFYNMFVGGQVDCTLREWIDSTHKHCSQIVLAIYVLHFVVSRFSGYHSCRLARVFSIYSTGTYVILYAHYFSWKVPTYDAADVGGISNKFIFSESNIKWSARDQSIFTWIISC